MDKTLTDYVRDMQVLDEGPTAFEEKLEKDICGYLNGFDFPFRIV